MKGIDWQTILFVGTQMIHEGWLYWGLPRVYYWDIKKPKKDDDYNDMNAA
ncbi:hypothetical protein [Oceanobacillus bengalensis]|nr:hypothetical protein [Oceanobacillus bengalensis]